MRPIMSKERLEGVLRKLFNDYLETLKLGKIQRKPIRSFSTRMP